MKFASLVLGAGLLLSGWTSPTHAVDPNVPGDLAVHVAISDDPRFSEKWIASAPSNAFVTSRLKEVRPGQAVHIGFLVTGHTAGADGRPDVVVSAAVRTPDGALLFDMPDCCTVRYETGQGGFVMADPAIDIRFDGTDPLGMWKVEATAIDKLAGTAATGSSTFELRK